MYSQIFLTASVRADSETPPRNSPRAGEILVGFRIPAFSEEAFLTGFSLTADFFLVAAVVVVAAAIVDLGVADLAAENKALQPLKTLAPPDEAIRE